MLNANHAALRDSFAMHQFNFIFVEIELGLTFCQAAHTTQWYSVGTGPHIPRLEFPLFPIAIEAR